MTLPVNNIYSLPSDFKSPQEISRYLRDLVYQMHTRDEQIAQAVNGDIRGSVFQQNENWSPVLKGSTTPGTFTYDHQVGWVLRQGLLVDVWFDIKWSASGTAAGNLYIELPYKVAVGDQKPFVGVLQPSLVTYGSSYADLVINGIPGTYRGEIWGVGTTLATSNLAIVATGQLIGHLRYLGVQNG